MFGNNEKEIKDILPKYKVDVSTAEAMFKEFCDGWDIDYHDLSDEKKRIVTERDEDGNTKEVGEQEESELEAFNEQKRKIIKRIMSGHAIYNNESESFEYTLVKGMRDAHGNKMADVKPLSITRGTESGAWGMTGNKSNDPFKVKDSRLASMTGLPIQTIGRFDPIDMKFLDAVLVLFLNG